MTTNIKIDAHPFNSSNGKPLEVVVETWDNGILVSTIKLQNGQIREHICCFEGREIRVTEREIDNV